MVLFFINPNLRDPTSEGEGTGERDEETDERLAAEIDVVEGEYAVSSLGKAGSANRPARVLYCSIKESASADKVEEAETARDPLGDNDSVVVPHDEVEADQV